MRVFWKRSCGICKAQGVDMIEYENQEGTRMVFCTSCKRYPERRSFKIVKHYRVKKKRNLVNVNKDVLS